MGETNFDYREEARKLIEFAKQICEATTVKKNLTKEACQEHEDATNCCKALRAEDDVKSIKDDFFKSKIPLDNRIEYPAGQLCNQFAVERELNVSSYHGLKTAEALQYGRINLSSPELSSSISQSMSLKRSGSSHEVESTEWRPGLESRGVNDKHTNFSTNSLLQGSITKSSEINASNNVDHVEGECRTNQGRDHSGSTAPKEGGSSADRGKTSQACIEFNHKSDFPPHRKRISLKEMKKKKLVEGAKNSTKLIKALLGKTNELQAPIVPASLRAPPALSSTPKDSFATYGSYADHSKSNQFSSIPQSRYQSPANYPAAFQFDVDRNSLTNTKEVLPYADSSGIAYTPGNTKHVTDIFHRPQLQGTFFPGINSESLQLQHPYMPCVVAPTTCNNDLFVPNHSKKRGGSPIASRDRSYQFPQADQQSQITPSIPKGSSRSIPERGSTRIRTKKVPKSLRRMGGIAKKYNLQEYND